jgi:hypothetical protein
MVREFSTHREKKNARRILVGNPDGKRPLAILRYGQMDNIKMDLAEMGWGGMHWTNLAQDRYQAVVKTVINLMIST